VIACLGFTVEMAIAVSEPAHAIWSGGLATVYAIGFAVWFWLTVAWAASILSRPIFASREQRRWLRWSKMAGLIAVLTAAVVAYASSWGLFLQTGRFANWEALRFALTNFGMLGDYLRAADAHQFLYLAALVGGSIAILPWLLRRLSGTRWNGTMPEGLGVRQLGFWLVLTTAVSGLKLTVANDGSLYRSVTRIDRIENCLNPAMTLVSSGVAAWRSEPIEPCLDLADLVPIATTTSENPQSAIRNPQTFPSVIIIAVESLRHDVVGLRENGREVTPNINALARRGVELTRAYAQSTHSDYADVCLPSSLYPLRTRHHHYYGSNDPWPQTLLHDVLKQRGYATAIISSQNEAWGGMDKFLATPGLDLFYHPETSNASNTLTSDRDPGFLRERRAGALLAGKFPDRHTTDVALNWIEKQTDESKPFYLSINFQSSHFPYLIPDDSPRPFKPYTMAPETRFSHYAAEQVPVVRNAYLNGMAECDRQIGRLVAKLRELGKLNNTILVVTGENGESFHENGVVGHACDPAEPVIHIAAIIHAPSLLRPRTDDYPFEHVDLAPTILGLMGLPSHPNFQGIDLFSPSRPPADERLVFVHVHSPIARSDAVILGGRWKLFVSFECPWGKLFDVVDDPTESRDLSESQPELKAKLLQTLETWQDRQLAYYHYPMYYQEYYPPRPPKWPLEADSDI
jgi:arylsulfatase A-like enzyme